MSVDLTPEERAKIVAERADVKYGPFASLHEAYGVIAEECDELDDALVSRSDGELLRSFMSILLRPLRQDATRDFLYVVEALRARVQRLAGYLHEGSQDHAIHEAIDVIAVCDRIIAQWGEQP